MPSVPDCVRHAHTAEEALAYFRNEMRMLAAKVGRQKFWERMGHKWAHAQPRELSLANAKFLRALSLEVGAGLPGVRE